MQKTLQYLRKIIFINTAVRWMLKKAIRLSEHWPVAGIMDVEFEKIKFKLYANCDEGFANLLYYEKKYFDESLLKTFIERSKQCNLILDVGACTGVFSILSSKVNPKAEIISFEPYYFNAQRLKKNIAINNCKNIQIIDYAIGKNNTRLPFSVPEKERIIDTPSFNPSHGKSVYPELAWKKIDVEQVSLDYFANKFLLGKKIDLLKIDVEDHELQVFEGMQEIIATHTPEIFFESYLTEEKINYFTALKVKYDYSLYALMPEGPMLINNFKQWGGINFILSKNKTLELPQTNLSGHHITTVAN